MQITQIITQANKTVELDFRVMERSLRSCGCDLPLRVIPYDEQRFDLPNNSTWLEFDGPLACLPSLAKHPCHQRYGVLSLGNYQYADTDIVFLRDPASVLSEFSGFLGTCTQWQDPSRAVTQESQRFFASHSANWALRMFNSGQFACESPVYSSDELLAQLRDPTHFATLFLDIPPWDQPGFNLLVFLKDVPYQSLTMPPVGMESSFAGHYGDNYEAIWKRAARPPYLIHWAGPCLDENLPINELFFSFLTRQELVLWKEKQRERVSRRKAQYRNSLGTRQRLVHDIKQLAKAVLN